MKCPTCPDVTLVLSDRQGVEIDYCPTCRGIWLDRGELDKLLDKAAIAVPAVAAAPAPRGRQNPDFEDSDYLGGQRYSQYRKKSWLNEIFD
jgi:Zn-finger nucleic acid-binding protein